MGSNENENKNPYAKTMSRLVRMLFYSIAVLLAILTGYLMFDSKDSADSETPEASASPEAPANMLFNTREPLNLIKYSSSDSAFEVSILSKGDNLYEYEVNSGASGFIYSAWRLDELRNAVTGLSSKLLVMENPGESNLAKYGVISGAPKLTLGFGGSEETLELGAVNATKDGRYCVYKNVIYLIDFDAGQTLAQGETSYRDLQFLPDRDGFPVPDTALSRIVVTKPGSVLEIAQATPEELELHNYEIDIFQVIRPISREGDSMVIRDKITYPISSLEASSVVRDNPAELAQYGLDGPIKLDVTLDDGSEHTLLIGKPENGLRYAMIEGIPSVLGFPEDQFTFLEVSGFDAISKYLWIESMDNVDTITYESGSEKHVLTLDVTDESFGASLDSKPMTGDEAELSVRTLFERTGGIMIEGLAPEGTVPGAAEYTITALKKDGVKTVIALSRYNERQYLATVDGKTEFIVGGAGFEKIKEYFSQTSGS